MYRADKLYNDMMAVDTAITVSYTHLTLPTIA